MSSVQRQPKVEPVPTLSQSDRARLMLNTEDLANRKVEVKGRLVPVMHLGIGALERFRAACGPIEELYKAFCEADLPLPDFMKLYRDECIDLFKVAVPRAASIALNMTVEDVKSGCRPVEAFSVVITQWVHNLEIGRLQELFPHPPKDDEEDSDDPNDGNPMTIVERLAATYQWGFDDLLRRTVPQIYLMGVSSAWSYERAKSQSESESGGSKKKLPIRVNGKRAENFKKLNSSQYKEYLASIFGGQPESSAPVLGVV